MEKPNERTYWFIKTARAGKTSQGRLRRFDEAIAWFVDENLKWWACIWHWITLSSCALFTNSATFKLQYTKRYVTANGRGN